MSRAGVAGAAGTTLMVSAAAIAMSLIWMTATEPLQLALAAAGGDPWKLITSAAGRVLALLW